MVTPPLPWAVHSNIWQHFQWRNSSRYPTWTSSGAAPALRSTSEHPPAGSFVLEEFFPLLRDQRNFLPMCLSSNCCSSLLFAQHLNRKKISELTNRIKLNSFQGFLWAKGALKGSDITFITCVWVEIMPGPKGQGCCFIDCFTSFSWKLAGFLRTRRFQYFPNHRGLKFCCLGLSELHQCCARAQKSLLHHIWKSCSGADLMI